MVEKYEPTPEELAAAMGAMKEEDKRFVLRSLWTQQQVAEIASTLQYEEYARWQSEIHAKMKEDGVLPTDLAYSRSQDGVMATSIGACMIEWEEHQASARTR